MKKGRGERRGEERRERSVERGGKGRVAREREEERVKMGRGLASTQAALAGFC